MCIQRTMDAISFIHSKKGFVSGPYLNNFGGAERSENQAKTALETLQGIMRDIGIQEAQHKVCQASQPRP